MTSPLINSEQACPVWVINLDRSLERMRSVSKNLGSYGVLFERISATDARSLTPDEVASVYDSELNHRIYYAPLKLGELGCFLSHRNTWHALASGSNDCALIIEDDVIFDTDPLMWMNELANWLKTQPPTLVKLYSRRSPSGKHIHTLPSSGIQLIEPDLPPLGTQAHMINQAAAKMLLVCTQKFAVPVDVALQAWWETGVRVLVAIPIPAKEVSENLGGSTLSTKNQPSLWQKLHREIVRPWYRTRRQLIAKFHAFKRDK